MKIFLKYIFIFLLGSFLEVEGDEKKDENINIFYVTFLH